MKRYLNLNAIAIYFFWLLILFLGAVIDCHFKKILVQIGYISAYCIAILAFWPIISSVWYYEKHCVLWKTSLRDGESHLPMIPSFLNHVSNDVSSGCDSIWPSIILLLVLGWGLQGDSRAIEKTGVGRCPKKSLKNMIAKCFLLLSQKCRNRPTKSPGI